MHPFIRSFTKEKEMQLSRRKASDKINLLKAIHKRLKAKEKKNG